MLTHRHSLIAEWSHSFILSAFRLITSSAACCLAGSFTDSTTKNSPPWAQLRSLGSYF